MSRGLPTDDPPARWNSEQLQRQFAAWHARSNPRRVRTLCHLDPATVFELTEPERPTSADLAIGLGLPLPVPRVLRRVTELPRPTPAVIGYRPIIAKTGRVSRRPVVRAVRRGRLANRAADAIQSIKRRWCQLRPKWRIELVDLGSFKSILIGFAIGFGFAVCTVLAIPLLAVSLQAAIDFVRSIIAN